MLNYVCGIIFYQNVLKFGYPQSQLHIFNI